VGTVDLLLGVITRFTVGLPSFGP